MSSDTTDSVGHRPNSCNTRTRNWSLTWNNYTEEDMTQLTQWCIDNTYKYTLGKEIGDEKKTPHIQGCIEFKNPRSFKALHKKFPKIHWSMTTNKIGASAYCKKQGQYVTNTEIKTRDDIYNDYMNEKYKDIIWHPFQMEIVNLIETKPDERTIHWYWERKGNIGKSMLCKYIDWKYKAIITGGKQTDIFNCIKNWLETHEGFPSIIIIDIPRTNEQYVSYGAIEKIKDGLFYSGKYEGGRIRLLPCHLIVFANFEPNTSTMSIDRWHVINIGEQHTHAP